MRNKWYLKVVIKNNMLIYWSTSSANSLCSVNSNYCVQMDCTIYFRKRLVLCVSVTMKMLSVIIHHLL